MASVLFITSGFVSTGLAHEQEEVMLQENLGPHTYPISTSVPRAQQYFDQGLILTYGFNHAEAARSFREAARLDPTCAMCFWGEALVLGPNINAPMDSSVIPKAYGAVQKALALTEKVAPKEEALIQALATRYAKDVGEDRSHLDQAYAEAMRNVFRKFPDDAVVGALFAEALMDLHPWDFWTKKGEAKPWTAEITSTLETVLKFAPNHPLANHLYIHAVEASPYPEKGLPSAKRLETLVPGSGHLVHMPAHIYIRVGQYRDAALANKRAVKIDQHYLSHSHTESIYTAAYVPHNYHFLWAATVKTGQKSVATQAAKETAAKVNPEAMRDPGFAGTLQHFWLMPLYTKTLFGQWAEVLREPIPPADLVYPAAIRHYARGLALVRQGNLEQAQQELQELKKIAKDPEMAKLTIFDLNSISTIVNIAEAILGGELAAAHEDTRSAVALLKKAIELEDGLNYTEPKDWYLPPRQVLGAVLIQAGRAKEAESVYRKDLEYHPQNGWSLFGLVQSLNRQGRTEEAQAVQQQFDLAWADADVTLTSSRF
ncbi:MAG: tetratricopeptide repeat protein [Nitrospirota bacterium]|nr:MAG: tetratricopeptide repeat protein [Nitrospirota bacterium]